MKKTKAKKKSPDKTGRTQGRWAKGTSGNPRGRPEGSRTRATMVALEMLEGKGGNVAVIDGMNIVPIAGTSPFMSIQTSADLKVPPYHRHL